MLVIAKDGCKICGDSVDPAADWTLLLHIWHGNDAGIALMHRLYVGLVQHEVVNGLCVAA